MIAGTGDPRRHAQAATALAEIAARRYEAAA